MDQNHEDNPYLAISSFKINLNSAKVLSNQIALIDGSFSAAKITAEFHLKKYHARPI